MIDFTQEELKALKIGGSLIGLGFMLAAIVMIIPFSILEVLSVILALASVVVGIGLILKAFGVEME